MHGAAERTLQFYVNESRYDMDFGTAALIPRDKLPEFLDSIDDRLLGLREAMVCHPVQAYDDIETEMHELNDCRAQIVQRMLDEDDVDVLDSAEDIIENIVVASLVHNEITRARNVLSDGEPRFVAELAERHARASREARVALDETIRGTTGMFRLGEEFEPNAGRILQRVLGLLEEIRDRVQIAYESDE